MESIMRHVVKFTVFMAILIGALLWLKPSLPDLLAAMVGAFSLVAVVFLGGLAALIVGKMVAGTIDLKYLIAEENGDASLSRFQMLLFTFVIAGLYFLYALYALYAMQKSGVAACPGSISEALKGLVQATGAAQDKASQTLATGPAAADDVKSAIAAAGNAAKNAADNLVQLCQGFNLPEIPNSVLGLIGISGGSYLLSKGINAASGSAPGGGGAGSGAAGGQAPGWQRPSSG